MKIAAAKKHYEAKARRNARKEQPNKTNQINITTNKQTRKLQNQKQSKQK